MHASHLILFSFQSSALDTNLIEDHCIESLAFRGDGLIAGYILLVFIGIVILGCFNCRITSHYKKEGELAILTGILSLILFGFFYLLAIVFSNGYTDVSRIKNHMPYVTGAIWLYSSFILTVLYLSKVRYSLR